MRGLRNVAQKSVTVIKCKSIGNKTARSEKWKIKLLWYVKKESLTENIKRLLTSTIADTISNETRIASANKWTNSITAGGICMTGWRIATLIYVWNK